MVRQLIFTSAAVGLIPGRSGFVTVARHRDLDETLVNQLERWSSYQRGAGGAEVFALRSWERSGRPCYILTRVVEAGVDYSGRANHLAHHLIFGAEDAEVAPDPAAIALGWDGWRGNWGGGPRWLGEGDQIHPERWQLAPLPAPGGAIAGWVKEGRAVRGRGTFLKGGERGWVAAVSEASRLLKDGPWSVTWASAPQSDESGLIWRGRVGEAWGFEAEEDVVRAEAEGKSSVTAKGVPRRIRVEDDSRKTVGERDEEVGGKKEARVEPEAAMGSSTGDGQGWFGVGLAGVGILGVVAISVWVAFAGGAGNRWESEMRQLMLQGDLTGIEDRLRLADRVGVPKGMESVWAEARRWAEAERVRQRLEGLRLGREAAGLERELRTLEVVGNLRELIEGSPRLGRELEEARRWLESRRTAELELEALGKRVELATGREREELLMQARLQVESLGGAEAERWRERLARLGAAPGGRESRTGEIQGQNVGVPWRVVAPVQADSSAVWTGGEVSRRVWNRLGADQAKIRMGAVGDDEGEPVEIVRERDRLKFYREVELLAEVRRLGGDGLTFRAPGMASGSPSRGWWLQVRVGEEVGTVWLMAPGEMGLEEPGWLVGLTEDRRVVQRVVGVDSVRLAQTIPVMEGWTAWLWLRAVRGGEEVIAESIKADLGEVGWEQQLQVDLQAGDRVQEAWLMVTDPAQGLVWKLLSLRGGN